MGRPLCLDLFSGAGGTAIGLHRAGFDVTHFEWDADACATLRAAFPGDAVAPPVAEALGRALLALENG